MTDDTRRYLAEVKARCEKAQAGPWSVVSESDGLWVVSPELPREEPLVAEITTERKEDAEFIASSRKDIPRLLALIERLSKGHADDCDIAAIEADCACKEVAR